MQLIVVLAVCAGVAVLEVNGQDICGPPKPGEKHAHPPECCKFENLIPESVKAASTKCRDKIPRPPRPSGPPPPGPPPPPSPEMKKHHACMAECVFTEAALISDGKVDKAALTKAFTSSNSELQAVITAGVDKCFASYEKDIDTSMECKSGASKMEECMVREVFINCPASLWTESSECSALKTKMSSCPNMPIMMHGPPRPH